MKVNVPVVFKHIFFGTDIADYFVNVRQLDELVVCEHTFFGTEIQETAF